MLAHSTASMSCAIAGRLITTNAELVQVTRSRKGERLALIKMHTFRFVEELVEAMNFVGERCSSTAGVFERCTLIGELFVHEKEWF